MIPVMMAGREICFFFAILFIELATIVTALGPKSSRYLTFQLPFLVVPNITDVLVITFLKNYLIVSEIYVLIYGRI